MTHKPDVPVWLIAAFALAAMFWQAPALAQSGHPQAVSRIGVIDVQLILRESKAYQSIRPQMQTLKKQFEEKFRAAEGELRTTNKDLQRERAILSPEAFAQRQRDFRKRVDSVQRDMQAVNRLLDRALSVAVGQIQAVARTVTSELAKEKNLDLVLSNTSITFAQERLNLTEEVLTHLNKRLPSVKVELPPPPKSADGKQ